MFKLVIQDDEGKTTVVPLIRDEITIGRKEGNTIRLTERNVSRRHARILRNNGEVHIEDLGSYNGIRVNNARIAERVSLRVSDQVQIGDYKLYLKAEGVEQVDDARTMPIERVDARTAELATDVVTAVTPTAQLTTPQPAQNGATTPMAVPPMPAPPPQIVGNPARTLVAIADTDPQGRPVATAATVAALTAPAAYGKLVVLSSNFAGKEFELSRPQMIIGRTDENDIVVNHRSISRNHAKLVREPDTGRYTISDLQSSNGVRVNGQDYGKVELRRGDVVDLGHVRLRFIEPGEDFVFARDAVITDVPDASNKRGMMVAVVLAIVLLGGVGAFFLLRDKGENAVANGQQGKLDADAAILAGNDPRPADAPTVAEVQTPDAMVVVPTGNDEADKLATQCLEHHVNARWDQLATCGGELDKLGDKRADEFQAIAAREKGAKAALARMTQALSGNRLRQARDELDKIDKSSQYAKQAREQFTKVEEDLLKGFIGNAQRKVDKNCRAHVAYLALLERDQGKPVADRVRQASTCTPEQVVAVRDPNPGTKDPTPKPSSCDVEELKAKGKDFFGKGQYGGALSAFEDALACSPSPSLSNLAAMSACRAGREKEARRHYRSVAAASRANVQQTCLQNNIQL